MKVLHLITDHKFIDTQVNKFSFEGIENIFLYFTSKPAYSGANEKLVVTVKPFSEDFYAYLKKISAYNAIVTHGVGYTQSVFINKLPLIRPQIFWCFFGAEIYNNKFLWKRKSLFAPLTRKVIGKHVVHLAIQRLYHMRFYLKNGVSMHSEIKKAIIKCDYFVWYIKEEYDLLADTLPISLPSFLLLPIVKKDAETGVIYQKSDSILLGNSGGIANNHIDVLSILDRANCRSKISMPLSYGLDKWYKKELEKYLRGTNLNAELMLDFVPYNLYLENFKKSAAAVYPSYRQMASGNIVMCILYGVKIYLSLRNPVYHWLTNNDLKVYTIEENLEEDVLSKNLTLDHLVIEQNKDAWNNLVNQQNSVKFEGVFKDIVRNRPDA